MRISNKAEQDKNSALESIEIMEAFFVNSPVGMLGSTAIGLFTPYKISHQWIILTTVSGSIYCIQFARPEQSEPSDESKSEIAVMDYPTVEAANEAGAKGVGNQKYRSVQEKKTTKGGTLEDVIDYLKSYDHSYNLALNNCQSLASDLYARFARLSLDDEIEDLRKAYNTPGVYIGKNIKSFTCAIS